MYGKNRTGKRKKSKRECNVWHYCVMKIIAVRFAMREINCERK